MGESLVIDLTHEVGDHVLVGFRHGDPNRPYVMGSLFNGRSGKGGGEGNCCKSISTRSGCSLTLNDGEGSVKLNDKGGAKITFDGNGNASTTANATATTSVGEDGASVLKMNKDGVIDLTGKTSITLKIGESSVILTEESITMNSENINIEGINNKITGSQNTINGKTNMEGQSIILKGSPVKIN